MRSLSLFVLSLFAALAGAAEVDPKQQEHTLIHVALSEGETAGVLSATFDPLVTAQTASGIVWTGPPGRYAVIVSGGRSGMQILPVVVHPRAIPGPPIPTPTPNPTPSPTPTPGPVPAEVLNKLGLGAFAYERAMEVNDRPGALVNAQLMSSLKTQLHQGRILPASARLSIESVDAKWQPWAKAVLAKIDEIAKTREAGSSIISWLNYCHELESALEVASKQQSRR